MKPRWSVPLLVILASGMALITAGCAPQPGHPQSAHVSGLPEVGATKAKESPLQLVVSLTDGSRVIGETTLTSLSFRSAVLGSVIIPLAKIRAIKFNANHESALVLLQNGDQLEGGPGSISLRLQTLLGMVTVPLEKTAEIEVRSGGGRLVEWDLLPFPRNSDWPGPQGEPATMIPNEAVLRGQPVRTKQTYPATLSFECDVTLEKLAINNGCLWIALVPEGSDPNLNWPAESVVVELGYNQINGRDGHLNINHGPTAIRLNDTPLVLEGGKPYRLSVKLLPDRMRVTLNGQAFEAKGMTLPFKACHIQLMGWQPANTWHVRNFTML